MPRISTLREISENYDCSGIKPGTPLEYLLKIMEPLLHIRKDQNRPGLLIFEREFLDGRIAHLAKRFTRGGVHQKHCPG